MAPRLPDPAPAAVPLPVAPVRPAPGEALIWWATTDLDGLALQTLRDDLDDETRTRIDALVREEDRRRGVIAHGLLRRLVAPAQRQAPSAIRIARSCRTCDATDHGKPGLVAPPGAERPPLQFNLAHSADCVVVAITDAATPVGVDVEHVRPGFDWASTRRHVFTDADWQASGADDDPASARFALWARKEAAVKCTGHGLAVELARVEVDQRPRPDGARHARLQAPDGMHELLVTDLTLLPGTMAAVAVPAEIGGILVTRVVRADLSAD